MKSILVLQYKLGIIEIIIDIVKLIAEYWNHYQNCQINMELWESLSLSHDGFGIIEMDNFCPPSLFVQAMTSLLLHKSLYFVHFGVTPNSPKPLTSFLDDPLPENYWKISQYIVIELIWILWNWYENIGNKIVIAKLIWKYWILYWYCKIYSAVLKSFLILLK